MRLRFKKIWFSKSSASNSSSESEKIREIAHCLYLNRQKSGQQGSADDDWRRATHLCRSPVHRVLFWINQPLIRTEKSAIEPIARWVERADLFYILERISPAIEALGVLAIPLVLFVASQNYQEKVIAREKTYQEALRKQESERFQQQALKDYFSQLSTLLLDLEGDLRDSENERLRTLTTATTLTLLREPNLNGYRKGQVVKFLAQMSLVNTDFSNADENLQDLVRIRLTGASLSGANLSKADLRGTNLSEANLSNANLSGSTLTRADLSSSDLGNANLYEANLADADLSDTNLSGANLVGADLSGADLSNANLSNINQPKIDAASSSFRVIRQAIPVDDRTGGAIFFYTNLKGAKLADTNMKNAIFYEADLREISLEEEDLANSLLCQTQLPTTMTISSDRDCETLSEMTVFTRFVHLRTHGVYQE